MKTNLHSQSGFLDSRALLSLAMIITGLYLTVFAAAKPQTLTSGPGRHLGVAVARGNSLPRPPLDSVQEAWVARYNGPGNGEDDATAIVVDGKGNVYVTGSSQGSGTGYDFATIKYDSNGQKQWVARYNGPANLDDFAKAAVVDGAGNVYVTGSSTGAGSGLDCVTIKYDFTGQQQWAARYNGPANLNDDCVGIAVDTSGNIYVTGSSQGSTTGYDYVTIKYDFIGQQQWVANYNGPANLDDTAAGIGLDALGNVYVIGTSLELWNGRDVADYATVKYDSAGQQQWVVRDAGFHLGSEAHAITVDASGNVYVTGGSGFIDSSLDYLTIKYNSAGQELWGRRYGGGYAFGADIATAIAVDSLGNVYVTGTSFVPATGFDYATVKYDSSGGSQWSVRYNGPANGEDDASSIAIDNSGNIYVTGQSVGSETGPDYATIKYEASGNQLWVARYNGPETGDASDSAAAVAVDGAGNAYVTGGSFASATGHDYATIKYVEGSTPCGQYATTSGTDTIVAGLTDTGNHTDDGDTFVSFPSGFTFQLYDNTYNGVNVNSNGRLDFVCVNEPFGYRPSCLPAPPNQCPYDYTIFPFWTDLQTDVGLSGCSTWGNGCGIFTSVSGSAPNRIFNIEWHAVLYVNNDQAVNFEARLYEGQSRFNLIYGTMNTAGNDESMIGGVQGTTGFFTQDFCLPVGPPPQNVSRAYTLVPCGSPTPTPTPTVTPSGTPTATPTATPTSTPTVTPCTGRCTPTPRPRPNPAPRPSP